MPVIEDYERIQAVAKSLRGLTDQADKMVKEGQNLSKVTIKVGIPGGAHSDFLEIVKLLKESNGKYGFGYDNQLASLGNLDIDNWSELKVKCGILLPIAELFYKKLRPPAPGRKGPLSWTP